jgi:hypothetical protein
MQHGDLAVYVRPRAVIVVEGVLCQVQPIKVKPRFRREQDRGYHISWNEIPLKRCVYLKDQWPETALDFITFVSEEFLETAVDFLNETRIAFDLCHYQPFDRFTAALRFQNDVMRVYDSDPARLDQYGQKGMAVVRGNDF